jgi:hypothetical protein
MQLEETMQKTSILLRGQTDLEEMDKQLSFKIRDVNSALQKDISENKEEFTNTQRNNEK